MSYKRAKRAGFPPFFITGRIYREAVTGLSADNADRRYAVGSQLITKRFEDLAQAAFADYGAHVGLRVHSSP
jgi:hypothetical protein